MSDKIVKTEEEWRAELDELSFEVTRRKATERAFTGKYWDEKRPGTYRCVCCEQPLFSSETKFESGSGWPSFTTPIEPEAIETETDTSFGMVRTEVLCSRCDAHLGHVFSDGPGDKGGQRYCINSAALDLEPSK